MFFIVSTIFALCALVGFLTVVIANSLVTVTVMMPSFFQLMDFGIDGTKTAQRYPFHNTFILICLGN